MKVCKSGCSCGCHWFGEDSDFAEGEKCMMCGGMPKPPKELNVKEWRLFGRDNDPMEIQFQILLYLNSSMGMFDTMGGIFGSVKDSGKGLADFFFDSLGKK